MPKTKYNYRRFEFKIEVDVYEALKKRSIETNINMSALIRDSIKESLKEYKK